MNSCCTTSIPTAARALALGRHIPLSNWVTSGAPWRHCSPCSGFQFTSKPPTTKLFVRCRGIATVQSGEHRKPLQWRPPEECLQCSNPPARADNGVLKIAVLLSGGVDSSVALRLLCAAGHSCTAFYLKIWFQEDFENFWSACPWDEDLSYAQSVCDQVGVKLHVVHFTEEYWKSVVSYIISEYKSGRTPNPDVLCNSRIKFGAFLNYIKTVDFDYVASGHYAHVQHSAMPMEGGNSVLHFSADKVKDQTYFLSQLSQEQLRKLVFPLGCMLKEEVRNLASIMGLPNKDRKDSQGLCFLGKVKFSEFVAKHIGEMEGLLLEAETGDFLGKHQGYWFYTIGQRQGLRLPGGPWYVVAKDIDNNVVFVSRNYFSTDKRRRHFCVQSIKWISGHPPTSLEGTKCKVRHGPKVYDCHIEIREEETKQAYYQDNLKDTTKQTLDVVLSEDDQGLAAGQFAAFYQGNICLGSGVIADSVEGTDFHICPKALEVARMKDKSMLGEPVKIKVPSNCSSTTKVDRTDGEKFENLSFGQYLKSLMTHDNLVRLFLLKVKQINTRMPPNLTGTRNKLM